MKGGYVPKETTHNGRVYQGRIDIPLENLRDLRDLLVTLRHEVLGHYGANTFAPDEKYPTFAAWFSPDGEALLQALVWVSWHEGPDW